MPIMDIDSTVTLAQPFNPPKVEELTTAALIAGGYTFPPLMPVSVSEGNTLLNVQVESGTYNQTQIDDIVSILNAVCVDPTRNQQTQGQINAAYIAQNLQYKDVFAEASYILDTGIALLPSPPTVAAYRTVLTNTVQSLAPLVGTAFETHFNLERAAQGIPTTIPISSMTLAQCATLDNVLHIWLNARKIDAVIAELTQG